jgi:hypothetical protein
MTSRRAARSPYAARPADDPEEVFRSRWGTPPTVRPQGTPPMRRSTMVHPVEVGNLAQSRRPGGLRRRNRRSSFNQTARPRFGVLDRLLKCGRPNASTGELAENCPSLSTAFRNYGDVFSMVMRPAVPAPRPSRAW